MRMAFFAPIHDFRLCLRSQTAFSGDEIFFCRYKMQNKKDCDFCFDLWYSLIHKLVLKALCNCPSFLSKERGKQEALICIEKHICRSTPWPIWPLSGLLHVKSLQFFMLISVACVHIYLDSGARVMELSPSPWGTPASARPGTHLGTYFIEEILMGIVKIVS